MSKNQKLLQRNIRLFGIYKIFTKRVFLPLTTIYAVQQAGLNVQQLGIIGTLASLLGLLSDSPTGYWADKHGRRRSSQVGALLAAAGAFIFVISTSFIGILTASLVMALGYSFLYGSMEALMHDTLLALKREHDYAKISSRAQSVGLVANAFFIATVPLLYPIDKRLPFVVGVVAYLALFWVASLLTEPPRMRHTTTQHNFIKTVRLFVHKKTVIFFACVGFIFAVGTATGDVFNLAIVELSLPVKYIGLLFSAGSLIGAVIGIYVHILKKLTFVQYVAVDFFFNTIPFVVYGFFKSLPLAVITFIASMAMWRFQSIMYQHYILQQYSTSRYKATLLSLLTNFRSLQEMWIAIAITTTAKHAGVLPSIAYSCIVLACFLPILLYSVKRFPTNAKASLGS